MSSFAPHFTLELIYKPYARPHLEYGDIIFQNAPIHENSLCPLSMDHVHNLIRKLESIQYSDLSITGAWEGTL